MTPSVLPPLCSNIFQTAAEKQLQELRAMLQKRDAENARLREQRDQQAAELVERRHKDAVKTSSLEQLKLLVDSRSASLIFHSTYFIADVLNRNV